MNQYTGKGQYDTRLIREALGPIADTWRDPLQQIRADRKAPLLQPEDYESPARMAKAFERRQFIRTGYKGLTFPTVAPEPIPKSQWLPGLRLPWLMDTWKQPAAKNKHAFALDISQPLERLGKSGGMDKNAVREVMLAHAYMPETAFDVDWLVFDGWSWLKSVNYHIPPPTAMERGRNAVHQVAKLMVLGVFTGSVLGSVQGWVDSRAAGFTHKAVQRAFMLNTSTRMSYHMSNTLILFTLWFRIVHAGVATFSAQPGYMNQAVAGFAAASLYNCRGGYKRAFSSGVICAAIACGAMYMHTHKHIFNPDTYLQMMNAYTSAHNEANARQLDTVRDLLRGEEIQAERYAKELARTKVRGRPMDIEAADDLLTHGRTVRMTDMLSSDENNPPRNIPIFDETEGEDTEETVDFYDFQKDDYEK